MSLEVREIGSFDELMGFAPRWREILTSSGEDDVFLSPEWIRCWWKAWGDLHGICSIVVLRNGELVGLAPLMLSSRGRVKRWTKLQFLATGPSDHLGVISKDDDPEVLDAIWRHVKGMSSWDVLELRELWASAPTLSSFQRHFPEFESAKGVSLYADLSIGEEAYYASSPQIEKHRKRYWKKLVREQGAEYREFRPGADLLPQLDELKRLNLKRWKDEGTSPFASQRMVDFLSYVVGEDPGKLGVTFKGIHIEDKVIALNLGFEYRKRYLYYIPGYDEEYARYSPGSVLRAKILEACLEQRFDQLDFLRGSEQHKMQFNAKDRGLMSVRVVRSGVVRSFEAKLREGDFS
jgi:CelD/BcsL family acetyltransferase involved in cellulose biosynthesis